MSAPATLPPALEGVVAELAEAERPRARRALDALLARLDAERVLEFATSGGDGDAVADWLALRHPGAAAALRRIEHRRDLDEVRRVLSLFVEAIAGRVVPIETARRDADHHRSLAAHLVSSDGRSLYLPERVDALGDRRLNFGWYKTAVLFQLGLYESGTFLLDAELLFNRSAAPRLARALFVALEPIRVEAFLLQRYPGIARELVPVRAHALSRRPPIERLAAGPRALERIVRYGLGDPAAWAGGGEETGVVRAALARLEQPGATVFDTAAVLRHLLPLLAALDGFAGQETAAADAANAADVDDTAPPIDYRGAVLIPPADRRPRRDRAEEPQPVAAGGGGAEGHVELIERLGRDGLGLLSMVDGDLLAAAASALHGGIDAVGAPDAPAPRGEQEPPAPAAQAASAFPRVLAAPLAARPEEFLYDEWDYTLLDYRRRHCRLTETPLTPTDPGGTLALRAAHAQLGDEIRRQFELLRPEALRTERRRRDGEELDFDRLVEAVVDRRAGRVHDDDLYTLRRRQEREVAAAFLVDLSASTGTALEPEQEAPAPDPPAYRYGGILDGGWDDDPLWAVPPAAQRLAAPPARRVIDVLREALVLLADALAVLGDRYAVYGFSGHGRRQVDFLVAKEFDDHDPQDCAARIAAMAPRQSTRMGPAIRHATRKLLRRPERLRVLLLLSDGYPQDHDYGEDRGQREYGLRDTQRALREAELLGIETFCITVDPAGHDYLRAMCPEGRYLVIDDLLALPGQLPKVYRRLTT